jgi:hypothetical protein
MPFFPKELGGAGYPVIPDLFTDYRDCSMRLKQIIWLLDGATCHNMSPSQIYEIVSLQDVFSEHTQATSHGVEDHDNIIRLLQKCNYMDRECAIRLVDSRYKNHKPWARTNMLETSFIDPDTGKKYLPLGRLVKFLRLRLISNRGLLFDINISRDPPTLSELKEVFDAKWEKVSHLFGAEMQQWHYTQSVSSTADWDCITRVKAVVSDFTNQVYIDNSIINQMYPKLTKEIPL